MVTVIGAGYSGLTTAAELTLRGHVVRVVCATRGSTPPITIVGTQVSDASAVSQITRFQSPHQPPPTPLSPG